jgi:hypothetical protein
MFLIGSPDQPFINRESLRTVDQKLREIRMHRVQEVIELAGDDGTWNPKHSRLSRSEPVISQDLKPFRSRLGPAVLWESVGIDFGDIGFLYFHLK